MHKHYETAKRAHNWTSFSPDKRADRIASYLTDQIFANFLATNPMLPELVITLPQSRPEGVRILEPGRYSAITVKPVEVEIEISKLLDESNKAMEDMPWKKQ